MAFGLLALAHVIADFMAQGKEMVRRKEAGRFSGYFGHFLVVLSSLMIIFAPMLHGRLAMALAFFAVLHIGIDLLKGVFTRWVRPAGEVGLFLVDQGLHFVAMLGFWLYWTPICGEEPWVRWSVETILPIEGRRWFQQMMQLWFNADLLSTLIMYITVIYGGAVFVRKVLDTAPIATPRTEEGSRCELQDTGRYIGMAERMILLTLTVVNATSAAAFVLTAKSIARYQELNQKDFAEYYLTGTLLSMGIALLGGLFLQRLWIVF